MLTPPDWKKNLASPWPSSSASEAEFEAIRREIEVLKSELESSEAVCQSDTQTKTPSVSRLEHCSQPARLGYFAGGIADDHSNLPGKLSDPIFLFF